MNCKECNSEKTDTEYGIQESEFWQKKEERKNEKESDRSINGSSYGCRVTCRLWGRI